jgi:hypothetical protein
MTKRRPTCAHARYLRYESDRKVEGHAAAHAPMAAMTSRRTRSSTSLGWGVESSWVEGRLGNGCA